MNTLLKTIHNKLVNLNTPSHIATRRSTVDINTRLPRLLELVTRGRLLRLLPRIARGVSHQILVDIDMCGGHTYRSRSLA